MDLQNITGRSFAYALDDKQETKLMKNKIYWLTLSQTPGIGPVKAQRLLKFFGDIKNIFSATNTDLANLKLNQTQIDFIKNPNWQPAEQALAWLDKNNSQLILFEDELYPALLREIHNAPIFLTVTGNAKILTQPQIAIVGARNATSAGCELAEQFAKTLVKRGLIITSGLALGIDAASHRGAISAGQTIAVLGTGLKYIYPRQNQKLAEDILSNGGAIISEFLPNTPPIAKNFPLRNRVISGLSRGVLVIEAGLPSGSLITARTALEQNREVFAVPGSIHNPLARGCHHLIRQGAKLVETVDDILEELNFSLDPSIKPRDEAIIKPQIKLENYNHLPTEYVAVLQQTGYEMTPLDMIIARSGLTAAQVSSILLSLELQGYVAAIPGGYLRAVTN